MSGAVSSQIFEVTIDYGHDRACYGLAWANRAQIEPTCHQVAFYLPAGDPFSKALDIYTHTRSSAALRAASLLATSFQSSRKFEKPC